MRQLLTLALLMGCFQIQPEPSFGDQSPAQTPSPAPAGVSGSGTADQTIISNPHASRRHGTRHGEIRGIVMLDGKPIPGATVLLRSGKTGYSRDTQSDKNGRYRFKELEPAQWTVTAVWRDKKHEETAPLREGKKLVRNLQLDAPQ